MRKLGLTFVIAGFLLMIGIVSAGVLGYYGSIEGTAEVEGPTFYASSESLDSISYKLLINQEPTSLGETEFVDGNVKWFITDSLGISSFYPANYTFHIKAKASEKGKITAQLQVLDSEGNIKEHICQANINVTSSKYKVYSNYCIGDELSLNPGDRIGWIMSDGTLNDVTYHIKMDGNTRIEVST